MSTGYVIPEPLTVPEVEQKTGWTYWSDSANGEGFTNGNSCWIHASIQDGKCWFFERFGIQDWQAIDEFVVKLGLVSEHDEEEFAKYFWTEDPS